MSVYDNNDDENINSVMLLTHLIIINNISV